MKVRRTARQQEPKIVSRVFTLLTSLVSLGPAIAGAEDLPPHIVEHLENDEVLEMYVFSEELPIAKSFAAYALSIRELERHLSGAGAEQIEFALGVSNEEAILLADDFIAAYYRIKERSDEYARNESCDGDLPVVFADDAYDVIQQTYDVENQAESDEYFRFMAKLSTNVAQSLESVLEAHRSNSAYFRIDHQKAYTRNARSVDADFALFCLGSESSK